MPEAGNPLPDAETPAPRDAGAGGPPPGTPTPLGELECDRCGYDLTAVARPSLDVTCPECGTHFAWPPPQKRAPWPPWWSIAVRMTWPTAALVVAVAVLALLPVGMIVMAFGWVLVLAAWGLTAIMLPVLRAFDLARAHALEPARERVSHALVAVGLGLNLLVTVLIGVACILIVALL